MNTIYIIFLALFINTQIGAPNLTDSKEIILDEAFTLQVDEAANYRQDITILLNKVNDSRCPEDMNCIWAGELVAELTIQFNDKRFEETLIMPAGGRAKGKNKFIFDDFTFSFLGEFSDRSDKSTRGEAGTPLRFILSKAGIDNK